MPIYVLVFTENLFGMLTKDLRDDYIENKSNLDVDEWPPNQPKTVVNVALIHYKDSRTEQELIEISKRHREGTPAVDKLAHHSRVTKDISKIFQIDVIKSAENETKPLKLILIEGAPGIGKTVLARRIAYLWAKKELLTNVNILFLLFLRDPELQSIKTAGQLIQYLSGNDLDEEEVKNCVKQIKELQVGIVMDGFDEYPIQLRRKSFIADVIKGKVFHNCTIVVTSRPTATIKLHSQADRRIEILGFAQEERDKYICESLDSPKQRKQIQDYLKCQPIINGLVYVPLHLAILLYLFGIQSKLPETLTEMNELFILHTIYRSLTKNGLIPDGVDTSVNCIKDLPKDVLDIVKGLSKLAFKGLQKSQLVFSYKEIQVHCSDIEKDMPGALNGFGLLQAVQHFSRKGYPGNTVSFNFLHFTMQEFLSALHVSDVSTTPYEQQLLLMEETFWNGKYNVMWMMYVGINGVNSQSFIHFLYKAKPGDDIGKLKLSSSIKLDKVKCLHLFQCFMEAKYEKVPKEISKIFCNNDMDFHDLQLLPHHISSLTLYISKYSMQLQTLNLRDCHIGDVGMSILKHYFTTNADKASSIKHIDLFGNNSVLLWNVYCAIFGQQNLVNLNWSSLGGRVNVEEIVTAMDNNATVQSLNISNNHFENYDAERIAEVLTSNATLQELDFSGNDITSRGALAISKCFCNSVKLQHLKMSWSNHFIDTDSSTISLTQTRIKDIDIEIVANVWCKNKIVTKLDLSRNRISDNGIEIISKCIESNRSVTKVDLSRNKLSDVSIRKISVALKLNQVVQIFDISHNKLSDDGVVAIIDCLKDNATLQQLNMSHNEISNGINFGKALKMNNILQVLDISKNNISDEGVIAIGKALRNYCRNYSMVTTNEVGNNEGNTQNYMLQKLDISYNSISSEGIIALSTYLKDNNTLQELTVSWIECVKTVILRSKRKFCDMSGLHFGDAGTALTSAFLYHNHRIQILNISCNDISDDGAVAISEYLEYNTLLQELNISHNEITNDGIIKILKSIDSSSSLCTLNLIHNVVTKSGLMVICDICKKLTTISSFHITYNEILDSSQDIYTTLVYFDSEYNKQIDQFTMNPRVQLSTQNRKMTYKAKVLCFCAKENASVRALDISNHDIASREAKIIAKAIQGNTTLKKLDISHNGISDDGITTISDCLKDNDTLQELNISYNKISNNGIINIGKALQSNITLKILDISNNKISDDGAVAIGVMLQSDMVTANEVVMNEGNTQTCILQNLDMSYNKISSEGILALGKYLRNNRTLQVLKTSWTSRNTPFILNGTKKVCNMSNNCLENTETILVSEFLFHNCKVQILDLSDNSILDDGAIAISEYLKANTTLKELAISKNKITNDGIIKIAEAIKENRTLSLLDVSVNNLERSTKVATALGDHLKHNNTLQVLGISWNDKQTSDTIYVYHVGINNECYVDDTWPEWTNNTVKNSYYIFHYRGVCKQQFSDTEAILLTALAHGNVDVKAIRIVNSQISDNAALVISDFLKKSKTIEKLELSMNIISDEAIKHIINAIQTNNTLRVLDVSFNNISDDEAVALSKYLKNNKTLLDLNLSHNEITSEGVVKILKSIHSNNQLCTLNLTHNIVTESQLMMIYNTSKSFSKIPLIQISYNKIVDNSHSIDTTLVNFRNDYNTAFNQLTTTKVKFDEQIERIHYRAQVLCFCAMDNNSIKELDISNHDITDKRGKIIVKALQGNRSLQKLDISHNDISDDGAVTISEYLKKNNTLQQLNMSHNQVSSFGIINIATALLTNITLQILDISHNNIYDDGAIAIGETLVNTKNPILQKLNLSYNNISIKGIVALSNYLKLKNTLQELKISWNNYENMLVLDNNSITKFSGLHFEDVGATLISAFLLQKDIQKLDVSFNDISDHGVIAISEYLKVNRTLQLLNISHNEITSEGIVKILESIHSNSPLHTLNLTHNMVTKSQLMIIYNGHIKFNNIPLIQISYNEIDDDFQSIYTTLIYLKGDHNIEFDQLMTSKVLLDKQNRRAGYEEKVLCICAMEGNFVEEVDISWSNITDEGAKIVAKALQRNSSLKELDISNNDIISHGIIEITEAIKVNTTLSLLDVSGNNMDRSAEVARALSDHLKHNNTLQVLKISWNDTEDTTYIYALGKNNECTCLYVENVWPVSEWTNNTVYFIDHCIYDTSSFNYCKFEFSETEAILLTALVHGNIDVTAIIIVNRKISDSATVVVSDFLKTNKTINKLKLSENIISTDAIKQIIKSIQNNTTLQILDISSNGISDDGGVTISEYLKANATLKELDISNNEITIDGIIEIAKAIAANTTLSLLDVSGNNISKSTKVAIALSDYLKHNNALQVLGISWNDTEDTTYVYHVGINKECYIDDTWPRSQWIVNTVHYASKDHHDFFCWDELKFSDIEAILLTALADNNVDAKTLKIVNSEVSDSAALVISDFLKANKIIEKLEMSNNIISINTITQIIKAAQTNTTLQILDISSNNIPDDGVVAIIKQLNNISLTSLSRIINIIKVNATLQILDLSHNNISDDGAVVISEYLKANTTLKELDISSNEITNDGIIKIAEAIKINTTLSLLDASENKMDRSTEVARALSVHLKHNNTLQVLGISWNDKHTSDTTYVYHVGNECYVDDTWPEWTNNTVKHSYHIFYYWGIRKQQFSDTEAILLTALAHGNVNVKTMKIINSEISDNAALVIKDFLKKNKTNEKLELSKNTISTEATKYIIKAIETNTTLQILDISSNKICDDVVVAISECLKHNMSLKVLDISHNNITEGIKIIANSIQVNTTLLKLFLYHNRISDDGVVAISECLTKNNTLQELSLSWDSTTTKGITKIAEAIAVNTGLHTLDLSSLYIDDDLITMHHLTSPRSILIDDDPVKLIMILLNAMDHNYTMMTLVLPTTVKKNEAVIKRKLNQINEERTKRSIKTLKLQNTAAN